MQTFTIYTNGSQQIMVQAEAYKVSKTGNFIYFYATKKLVATVVARNVVCIMGEATTDEAE